MLSARQPYQPTAPLHAVLGLDDVARLLVGVLELQRLGVDTLLELSQLVGLEDCGIFELVKGKGRMGQKREGTYGK